MKYKRYIFDIKISVTWSIHSNLLILFRILDVIFSKPNYWLMGRNHKCVKFKMWTSYLAICLLVRSSQNRTFPNLKYERLNILSIMILYNICSFTRLTTTILTMVFNNLYKLILLYTLNWSCTKPILQELHRAISSFAFQLPYIYQIYIVECFIQIQMRAG